MSIGDTNIGKTKTFAPLPVVRRHGNMETAGLAAITIGWGNWPKIMRIIFSEEVGWKLMLTFREQVEEFRDSLRLPGSKTQLAYTNNK